MAEKTSTLGVAIIGCGTVGGAAASILTAAIRRSAPWPS